MRVGLFLERARARGILKLFSKKRSDTTIETIVNELPGRVSIKRYFSHRIAKLPCMSSYDVNIVKFTPLSFFIYC